MMQAWSSFNLPEYFDFLREPRLVVWLLLGAVIAAPIEWHLRLHGREDPYRLTLGFVLVALLLRITVAFFAGGASLNSLPKFDIVAFVVGLTSYVATIQLMRIIVAIDIMIEVVKRAGQLKLEEQSKSDSAKSSGGKPATSDASPRSLTWKNAIDLRF